MNGLVFASYRFLLKIQLDNLTSIPTIGQIALAGTGSGIISSYVTGFHDHFETDITSKPLVPVEL